MHVNVVDNKTNCMSLTLAIKKIFKLYIGMNIPVHKILLILSILMFSVMTLRAEIILRGGYLYQNLSTSKGYNNFIKDRYGSIRPQISGKTMSVSYKGTNTFWGLGIESNDLTGDINYKTLNGNNQSNTIRLNNEIYLLSLFLGQFNNIKIDLGLGNSKLTREFYGYQDNFITVSNIDSQQGTKKIKSVAKIKMYQIIYSFFISSFSFDLGGRYSENSHSINSSDQRPAYDSKGVPTETNFDLGGIGFVGTLSYYF